MKLSMIAAMAHNRVIGKDNDMPWHLPADLKFFKQTTLGKPVIMGRKTYDSIGRPLPGRLNIVITRDPSWQAQGVTAVTDPEAALALVTNEPEAMVIGGGGIYQTFLPLADQLYLTFIDAKIEGDTQFPDYEAAATWQMVASEQFQADERNAHNLEFVTLVKQA